MMDYYLYLQAVLRQQRHFEQVRSMSAKVNTVVCFVPQQEAWIIERFGKFNRTLEPVSVNYGSYRSKFLDGEYFMIKLSYKVINVQASKQTNLLEN